MPYDSSDRSEQSLALAAYVCTDQGAALARQALRICGAGDDDLHGAGLSGAARCLGDSAVGPAAALLVEMGNLPTEMACACLTELSRSRARVVVLGQKDDLETYRALRRAGATEYFTLSATAEDIVAAFQGAALPPAATEPAAPAPAAPAAAAAARSLAVVGATGGVGASLLAQNLAFLAAGSRKDPHRTALLDADLNFGSQAVDLDRDDSTGLFEALSAPDRVDATFLKASMDQVSDHLSIYSQQLRAGQDASPLEAALPRLMPALRAAHELVVTDLPRDLLARDMALLDHVDRLVLTIPAGFAGVNAASRLIERIRIDHPELLILPVLSEVRRDAGLSPRDLQEAIGTPVVVRLPRCDTPMARAHRSARPLVVRQPRGAYAKAVRAVLAAGLAETAPGAGRKRWSLFGKAAA